MSLEAIASAGVDIHMFPVEDFLRALDDSGDLRRGQTISDLADLLVDKWMEMDDMLIYDLDMMGIESPLVVDVEDDGSWTFVDGHHRLAWAVLRGVQVPVVFQTADSDPICFWEAVAEFEIFYNHGLTVEAMAN